MSKQTRAVVGDAVKYAATFGMRLSKELRCVLSETEELAERLDTYVYQSTFMTVILHHSKPVRAVLAKHGADPDSAAKLFLDTTVTEARNSGTGTSYDA